MLNYEADLSRARSAHRALVDGLRHAFPEADEQTIADTAEGESTLDSAIAAVLRESIEAKAMAKALGELLKESQERKRRLEARGDKLRVIALQAAEESGMKIIRVPDITAVVMHGQPAVIITDEDLLPDECIEISRVPRKAVIGDMLRAGDAVAGAMLGNRSSYWMVRRS